MVLIYNGTTFEVGDLVQIKSATEINKICAVGKTYSAYMMASIYSNGACKDSGKTVKITATVNGYFEVEPHLEKITVLYLDYSWVDKIFTTGITIKTGTGNSSSGGIVITTGSGGTASANIPTGVVIPKSTPQPILYKKGDQVVVKSNIDPLKSYSYLYASTNYATYINALLPWGGSLATVESDVLKNQHCDLVLSIKGVRYYADNFWVEPYIVSQSTILTPPKDGPKVSVEDVVVTSLPKSYAWCDACGGHGKHKLQCPPKSLIRSKVF